MSLRPAEALIPHPSALIPERMWNDRLRFAETVEKQWLALAAADHDALLKAFELIDEDPIIGAPLLEPLRGYWSYRTGALRVVYRIAPEARFAVVLWLGKA